MMEPNEIMEKLQTLSVHVDKFPRGEEDAETKRKTLIFNFFEPAHFLSNSNSLLEIPRCWFASLWWVKFCFGAVNFVLRFHSLLIRAESAIAYDKEINLLEIEIETDVKNYASKRDWDMLVHGEIS